MGREEQVNFAQDRLGNEKKELDDVRAQEGNSADTNSGIVSVAGGAQELAYKIPDEAEAAHLSYIMLHLPSSAGAAHSVRIEDAELDNNNNITSSTDRSVPISVSPGATRTVGYEGSEFSNGGVSVTETTGGASTVEVGLSFYTDTNEVE